MSGSILVIGACGQVGTELVLKLRSIFGDNEVIASDIREPENLALKSGGPFEKLDVLDKSALLGVVKKYGVDRVYNLAALLSATAEKNPEFGWKLNMDGHFNVLDLARDGEIKRIFWPSSIAVFGPSTPKDNTPQHTVMDPSTVYGISKLAGERWCEYYNQRWGVDVRSVRYPGLISWGAEPGGGTTDYAVEIFYEALRKGSYTSFLDKGTVLPMLYMPDAIKATIDILEAPEDNIKVRSSYNLAGFSFGPEDIAAAIAKNLPNFEMDYKPDFRQAIAESWPRSIDDSVAREDWGWQNDFDMNGMTLDMLENLKATLNIAT